MYFDFVSPIHSITEQPLYLLSNLETYTVEIKQFVGLCNVLLSFLLVFTNLLFHSENVMNS